jgi:hypothetical protein
MIGNSLDVELKAQNLFDEPIEWTQGGQVYEKYDLGVTYSVGLRMNF